ncbi:MAG: methyltransferase domain-containing protein, partial [Candidatus Adiutrix sp.]|nr:methyltransferase domain-containing protein [Candidatus Adiutrix sp.]
ETEERIANLRKYENFTYIPPIKYEEIPSYAYNFSVAVIPFQINKITKGTNPVKLFEYMAMGLPIVTTPMPECQLYESVITADGVGEFSLAIANAIPLKGDREYQKTLRREASENTWAARIDDMLSIIKKYNAPRPLLLDVYDRNRDWITRNTIPEEGVIVVKSMTNNAYEGTAYPEVSGYFIPTLLNWGYRDLAAQYAKWLLTIQHDDGSWYDCFDTLPHVFDTGQILKGLIAIQPIMPNAKNAILSGCDWIIRQIDDKGKLQSPHGNLWAIPTCSDLIHLYCLSPILKAGEMFDRPEYIAAVNKVVSYYKANDMDGLLDFHTLSHFYAYIVEALVDLGEADLAKRAMENVAKLQRPDGSVPAYKDVNWLCSTGLFQFAVIWYKLGEKDRADRAFDAACRLQEKSGGWRGSYGEGADYSRDEEISWANKYFMDAMALKISAHFAATACEDTILGDGAYKLVDEIGDNDGRLRLVLDTIQSIGAYSVLDVGCGFGRILKNIKKMNRNIYLCGVDISEAIVSKLPAGEIEGKVGSLLQIPYEDNYFDFVTTTEALEHAVDIENAVKELVRVTKPGGHIQIIDKNIKCWGMYKTPDWEQWFDKNELAGLLRKNGCNVSVTENIPYDDSDGKNGLFIGWLAEKRKPGFLRSLNRHRRSLRKKKREQKKKRRLESAIEQTMDLVQSSSVSKYYKTYRKHEKHYWEKAVVWLCDHVLSMRGDITVLDIGCAYGTLAVFCKTYLAADVYAVDLFDHYYPKNLFDRLKINFKRMNVELEPLNFKNNFDVVILTEVLEHFNFHPVPTLKRIRDVMKDNAVLYLTTPNAAVVGKITTHYNHLKDIPMPNNNTCIHDEHIWQYNIDELVSVINASGLMVTNIDTSNDGQQFNLAIMKRG